MRMLAGAQGMWPSQSHLSHKRAEARAVLQASGAGPEPQLSGNSSTRNPPPPQCASSLRMGVSTGTTARGGACGHKSESARRCLIHFRGASFISPVTSFLCPCCHIPITSPFTPFHTSCPAYYLVPIHAPLHISCPASFHFSIHVLYQVPDHVPGSAGCTRRSIGDRRRQSSRALDGGRGRPTGKRQVPVVLPRLDVADRGSGVGVRGMICSPPPASRVRTAKARCGRSETARARPSCVGGGIAPLVLPLSVRTRTTARLSNSSCRPRLAPLLAGRAHAEPAQP